LATIQRPAPFVAVHERLAAAGQVQFLTSLANQQYLLDHLGAPALVLGGGISALPSVHNGMAVLFAVASFRISRLVGLAMSLFALLVWVASVYLNWHYAVDGIAGAAGALLIWSGAGRIVDSLLKEELRSEVEHDLHPALREEVLTYR
jgi:membrane-associated phospholipid phosphatase